MSDDQRVYTISDSHWTGISCSCCNGVRAKRLAIKYGAPMR